MLQRIFAPGACLALVLFCAPLARAQENKIELPKASLRSLTVYPPRVSLDGPRDEQRLGVLGNYVDGRSWDLSRVAKFRGNAPHVVRVDEQGIIRPVGDGQAVVTVEAGGQTATVPVTVQRATVDIPVAFTREVVPVLTKAGCNQGACHGAQHGRGGFKLSLLGYDALFDYAQIVQSAEGRRIVLSDPERSILLQKSALVMEHAGGERFKVNGREYNLLKRWLEDGVPEPNLSDPETASLVVWPPHRLMVPGEQQQIVARVTWKDGRSEDITATAQFDTLNDGVASVTPTGLVTAKSRGETHIMVRFAGQAAVVQITLPYAQMDNFPTLPRHNFIDDKMVAKWQSLGLTPAPLCSDLEFFRRIHLDTIGTLPTPADIKAFLADPSATKRQKAIDKVLERPEFVDYWALKWGDLLRINRDALTERGMWSFHNWVRSCLRDRKPVDEMAREVITAEGSTFTEGPANFFLVGNSPSDWAETTAQVFLGQRIGCAKCHTHPFEKWTQDDYYGMAAFFVRLGTKGSQEFGLFGQERVVFLRSGGEQTHPRKGGVVPPHPLDGPLMTDPLDRRVKLAEWMTAPTNPFFAKNIVNRFWGYYLGRGLVEPLDDMRATNPASNPELLEALAKDFMAHKYDLRHLLRTIMNARVYQLSSQVTVGNQADAQNVHYARFGVRRLTAEQLADALDFATGIQEKYPGLPLGTRAIQLPDSRVNSFLLDTFGRPARQITCECERTSLPNITQALHLLNGDALNRKLASPAGRLDKLLKDKKPVPEIVEELYLVTLSRPSRPEELQRAVSWINQAPSPREGLQDMLWVLLNAREFLFVQ